MNVPSRIAVIGVGNEYRRDDGVGWAVLSYLSERARSRPLPAGTTLNTCDGDITQLIAAWEGAQLAIVVDAARACPASPGHVHRLEIGDEQPWQTGIGTSSHGLRLHDAIEFARVLDRLPRQLVVFAVEIADTDLGVGLSPRVANLVRPLALRIEEEIAHVAGCVTDLRSPRIQ
ncbi:hydrogenase maturation protease [Saccharopolyspora sp. NPDC002376]